VVNRIVRFWLGLATGLVVGVALGWVATDRPWRQGRTSAAAPADAGAEIEKPHKRRKPGRGRRSDEPGDEVPARIVPASERAMTWRGSAISLPAREIDLGAADSSRPLEATEINDVVEHSSSAVLDCVREALAGASLEGEVRLTMLVTGDGKVTQVRVGAPRWLIDHGLAECASGAARRMRFPATGAATVVDAPYHID